MQAILRKLKGYLLYPFAKYFLPYAAIISLLFLGFMLLSRTQLTNAFTSNTYETTQLKTSYLYSTLDNEVSVISTINTRLTEYAAKHLYKNTNPRWAEYEIYNDMMDFCLSNTMIDVIIYINTDQKQAISTQNHIAIQENNLLLYSISATSSFVLPIDLSVEPARHDRVFLLANEQESLLVYAPAPDRDSYRFIYLLNIFEVESIMRSLLGDGAVAYVLTDNLNGNRLSTEKDLQAYPLQKHDPMDETLTKHGPYSMYSQTELYGTFALTAILSNAEIAADVSAAFRNSYITMLFLGIVCLLLSLLGLRITYFPLKRLLLKVVPNAELQRSYVQQLDETFEKSNEEVQQLRKKYDGYHRNMQETLLTPILESYSEDAGVLADLDFDRLFSLPEGTRLHLIYVAAASDVSHLQLQRKIDGQLGQGAAVLVSTSKNAATYILCHQPDPEAPDLLNALLWSLHSDYGVQIAVSKGANSILDLPMLYETMMIANELTNRAPVSIYTRLQPEQQTNTMVAFPTEQLKQFSSALEKLDFSAATDISANLFVWLDERCLEDSKPSEYYTRCLLINMLNDILNCMLLYKVDPNLYYQSYADALLLYREVSYAQETERLRHTMLEMIRLCAKHVVCCRMEAENFHAYLDANCHNPDLSIQQMADDFSVSATYMSLTIADKCGSSFADLLWEHRLALYEKLCETTDWSIEKMAQEIGYVNVSSFRRKLKNATGQTPSQYREFVLNGQKKCE